MEAKIATVTERINLCSHVYLRDRINTPTIQHTGSKGAWSKGMWTQGGANTRGVAKGDTVARKGCNGQSSVAHAPGC